MINKFRRLLIRIGKILPFVMCFIVLIGYVESCIALYFNDYVLYGNDTILNTKVSFAINKFIEYDIQILVVLCIISVAIETCVYNKLSCAYLGINLLEKSYFSTIELYPEYIYLICVTNIIVSAFFVWKGLRILINQ